MGRVSDEERALNTTCHGFRYENPRTGKESLVVYSDGVKGVLTKKQIPDFCSLGMEVEEATEKMKNQLESLGVCLDESAKETMRKALEGLGGKEAEEALRELELIPICEVAK